VLKDFQHLNAAAADFSVFCLSAAWLGLSARTQAKIKAGKP
jgi:hypothetical protein